MSLIDISVPILPSLSKGMHIYPGDTPVYVSAHKTLHKDQVSLSRLEMGSHTGTHIDAPSHFIEGGARTEEASLDALVGPAWVADCTEVKEAITAEHLEALQLDVQTERILFKTRNSALWERSYFQTTFVFLTPDGASWLVERGIRTVGIDYLSIEKFGMRPPETHHILLGAGIVIIEGLNLSNVEPNRSYTLTCLPLKIPGIDGAPARAILAT